MKYTTVFNAITFIKSYNAYVGVDPVSKTKLFIYCSKQAKILVDALEIHYDNVENDKVRNCAVDKDGFVIRDPKGNLQFTREGTLGLSISIRDRMKLSVGFDLCIGKDVIDECPVGCDGYKKFIQEFVESLTDEPTTKLIQEEYVKS